MEKYRPIVLTGPSGAGKGTMVEYLLQNYPDTFSLSVSYATRQPRQGEVNGVHYHFVTVEEFKAEIAKNSFVEYCEVHGNYYGTHLKKLQEIVDNKKIPLLDIDVQGGEKIHKVFPEWQYIFLNVRSLQEQEERLRKRGTETEEQILKRIGNAKKEIDRLKQLPYYQEIVNGELEETKAKFDQYLKKNYKQINKKK